VAIVAAVPRSPHVAKLIRFPPDVYERLEAAAREDRRSITGMVVRLVEEALERRRQQRTPPRVADEGPPYRADGGT
jgi:hypothetical protein